MHENPHEGRRWDAARTISNGIQSLALRKEMIAYHWFAPRPRIGDARAFLEARLREEEKKRPSSESKRLRRPSTRTLERWIRVVGNFRTGRARRGGGGRLAGTTNRRSPAGAVLGDVLERAWLSMAFDCRHRILEQRRNCPRLAWILLPDVRPSCIAPAPA